MGAPRARILLVAFAASFATFAHADTLTWKDGRQTKGRVLASFRDHLYVELGADQPTFVRRSELEKVLGPTDEPIPPAQTASPTLAVNSPVGEVRLEPAGAPAQAVTEFAFAYPQDKIVTGDTGLARIVFLSKAVLKIGPSTTLGARAASDIADSVKLERGQLFLSPTESRGIEVELTPSLKVTAKDGPVALERGATTIQLATQAGTAQIEAPGLRATIPATHALRLEATQEGMKVTAERDNADAVELALGSETKSLAPGDSITIEGSPITARTSGSWKITRMKGSVLVHAAQDSRYTPVTPQEMEQVRLDQGDSIATESNSEAVLTRDDGAALSLRESSELHFGQQIALAAGAVKVEALREAVPLALPVGEARLSYVSLEARKPSREATTLELATLDGDMKLALPGALAIVPKKARIRLDGGNEESTIHAVEGTTTLAMTAQAEAGDPEVTVALQAGHDATVRALHAKGIQLALEGNRTLTLGPERVGARVVLGGEYPRVVFAKGQELSLEKEVTLGLGTEKSAPAVRFPNAAVVTLPDGGLRATLGIPARFVVGDGTAVSAKNGVHVSLRGSEGLAGAVIGARHEDRFEIPRHSGATIARRGNESTWLKLEDGRGLIVEDGAPAVQARLTSDPGSAPRATPLKTDVGDPSALALTMPGAAPLTIAGSRRVTVLATRQGEFIILDDPSVLDAAANTSGLIPLSSSGPGSAFALDPNPNHIPEVLAQPPPASPIK